MSYLVEVLNDGNIWEVVSTDVEIVEGKVIYDHKKIPIMISSAMEKTVEKLKSSFHVVSTHKVVDNIFDKVIVFRVSKLMEDVF
jgi:hypothetical protein